MATSSGLDAGPRTAYGRTLMRAADLMTRELITVNPETTVEDLCDRFRDHRITAAPVVDAEGRLVGIVSKDDIIFHGRRDQADHVGADIKRLLSAGFVGFGPDIVTSLRVSDIMTRDVVTASETDGIEDLCRLMWDRRVHRIPIVRDSLLVGIVSALDVCRSVAGGALRPR